MKCWFVMLVVVVEVWVVEVWCDIWFIIPII